MLKWILGTVLGAIIGIAGYFYFSLGGFKPVRIIEQRHEVLHLLYKDHQGAYDKVISDINYVENWAKSHQLSCAKSFGQYLDDPTTVEVGRLRARVGCLVEEPENFPAEIVKDLPADVKTMEVPASLYINAYFEGAPSIGPMKVYPKVAEYAEAKKYQLGPVLEVYEIHSEKEVTTTYFFPVSNPAN